VLTERLLRREHEKLNEDAEEQRQHAVIDVQTAVVAIHAAVVAIHAAGVAIHAAVASDVFGAVSGVDFPCLLARCLSISSNTRCLQINKIRTLFFFLPLSSKSLGSTKVVVEE